MIRMAGTWRQNAMTMAENRRKIQEESKQISFNKQSSPACKVRVMVIMIMCLKVMVTAEDGGR